MKLDGALERMGGAIALLVAGAMAALGTGVAAQPDRHAAQPAASHGLTGNPANGAKVYQSCMGCHSLDDNDVGPKHRGLVGRRAGTVAGYDYSPALRKSGIVWTPANIDRWLTNPQKLVPGAKMYFSVAKPQDRADVIAYLATQK